jgi:pimeloyl-ACP methyl ester carboxylesterase
MIRYIDNNQDQTILFLHGLACDASYFDRLMIEFKGMYNFILPELLGHYDKSLKVFSLDDDVEKIVNYCAIKKINYNIIIAHSMSSILAFKLNKKEGPMKSIFLLEGNIINEDFLWSSQIQDMSYEVFLKYWSQFVKQYPLLLKMKLKVKLDLSKYVKGIMHFDPSGIYQYSQLISSYQDKMDFFKDLYSNTVYLESKNSKLAKKKEFFATENRMKIRLIENSSHYMMLDACIQISEIVKEEACL